MTRQSPLREIADPKLRGSASGRALAGLAQDEALRFKARAPTLDKLPAVT